MFGFGKGKIEATTGLVDATGKALDGLFTSDEERQAGQIVLSKIQQNPQQWAHELNVLNAHSTSLFVSGWRPAMGWVLVLGVLMTFGSQMIGIQIPDTDLLWQLSAVMFGARSFEKTKGVARS